MCRRTLIVYSIAKFHSTRSQSVCLEGKVSTSVLLVLGVFQESVLGPLLFILDTCELFHIVGNYIEGYAGDTTIYVVSSRPLLRTEVIESMNQNLAAINSRCLKWHLRLTSKKTKSMVVSRSQTIAIGYVISLLVVLNLRKYRVCVFLE